MTDWIIALASLSPVVAITLLFVWGRRGDRKAKAKEAETQIAFIKVLAEEFVEPITKGLDANTEATKENAQAVHESVQHNKDLIDNHLSGQARRDEVQASRDALMLEELRNVTEALDLSNHRRRATDQP